MNFTDYTRKDIIDPIAESNAIKFIKSKLVLQKNLEAGKKERIFKGIGSYLEVKVEKKGKTYNINIPFFKEIKNDKLINITKKNTINPIAEEVLEKVFYKKAPKFDLDSFKVEKIAELNSKIAANLTNATLVKEFDEKKSAINLCEKKDSQRLVKAEIKELEQELHKGLDLSSCVDDTAKNEAIKSYIDKYEKLFTLKSQVRHMAFSQKKGLSKLNNNKFKSVASIATAGLLGFFGVNHHFLKNDSNVSNNKQSNQKITDTITPTNTSENTIIQNSIITSVPKVTENPYVIVTPIVTKVPEVIATVAYTTPTPTIYTYNFKDLLSEAYALNLENFSHLKSYAENYGLNYSSLVKGYTFVEHINNIPLNSVSDKEFEQNIANARTFASIIVLSNSYDIVPLRTETLNTIQNCLNGNLRTGKEFVRLAHESNEPLLDMIIVGEVEINLLFEQDLLDFSSNIYLNEIKEYKKEFSKGTLKVLPKEVAKIKVLKRNI